MSNNKRIEAPAWRPYMRKYPRWEEMSQKERRLLLKQILEAEDIGDSKYAGELIEEDNDERQI